jgi:Ca2+-transporting ATPase
MDLYRLEKKEVFKKLGSDIRGLKLSEVQSRQQKYGRNIIEIEKKISFFNLLAKQFKNYLVWLLISVTIIAFIAGFYLKREEQIMDGIIISFIVLINAFIGAYQDYKSERAAQLLTSMLKNEAIVIRENKKIKVDSSELVPGDIIVLEQGNKIPGDCRIISCEELRVDESMLTGESVQVLKSAKTIKKEAPLAERVNMVFMNTFVARGAATCIVAATGKETEIGKIAKSLEVHQESLFLDEVDDASKRISYVAMALILVALAVYYFYDHHWISIFMLGSALIIGSIPEGLPAVVTFALSMASSKLARENVLVKRKTLLETLGSVDVICTDKTGTLTENKMIVKKVFLQGKIAGSLNGVNKDILEHLRNSALLCNEAKDTVKGFLGGAEDIALVDFFNKQGVDIIMLRKKYPAVRFEPFSSEKKFARSTNKIGNKNIRYTKGAPEVVLDQCKKIIKKGKVVPLNKRDKVAISKAIEKFSEEALRTMAFSCDDIFIGLIAMNDPPKKGIKEVVRTIYSANIALTMITGDNIHTATAIAKECGFKNINAINWDEVKDLSESELQSCVKKYNVFARMSPEYKLKIVFALQNIGKRVAITGDGVNDVPALKKADVGVAMGKRGSDIAKEAADLIVVDDNLQSIVTGIKEGRTIFSNMRKVINYLLTANLAEVLLVFITSLFGLMPFLAIQLLWVNFVTDIAPAMTLGIDPAHKNIMKKKPTGKGEKLINRRIVWLTVGISVKKVILMLALFLITYKLTSNLALAQTMTFTWLVFSHFVRVAAIRFDEKVNIFVNKYVNWSILIPVIIQLIIIYTPISKLFHTVPLTLSEWLIIIPIIIIAIGLAKVITNIIDKNLPLSERDY